MAPRTRQIAFAAAATLFGFILWLIGGWSHGEALAVVDDALLAAFSLTATVFAGLAARSAHGRIRVAWTALAIGLAGWVVGEIIWTYYEAVAHQDPFPSLADAGFLLFPVGACAALLLFPDDYSNLSLGRVLLDGLIVAGSLFLISWVTVLGRVHETDTYNNLDFVVSLAYPVSDVVVLTVAAMVLVRAKTSQRMILTLLTVGIACIAVADSAFVYLGSSENYSSGDTVDIGWAAGFLLITVAGAAGRVSGPAEEEPDEGPPRHPLDLD